YSAHLDSELPPQSFLGPEFPPALTPTSPRRFSPGPKELLPDDDVPSVPSVPFSPGPKELLPDDDVPRDSESP
ncbi:hypothetical protein HGM15179_022197, partial [Zosterops borbonicus]